MVSASRRVSGSGGGGDGGTTAGCGPAERRSIPVIAPSQAAPREADLLPSARTCVALEPAG